MFAHQSEAELSSLVHPSATTSHRSPARLAARVLELQWTVRHRQCSVECYRVTSARRGTTEPSPRWLEGHTRVSSAAASWVSR